MAKYHSHIIRLFVIPYVVLFPLCLISYAGDYNEPDKFNGIKWGTSIDELKDMVLYQREDDKIVCLGKYDTMKFGGADVIRKAYIFTRNKFSSVVIMFKNDKNADNIRKFLYDTHGYVFSDKVDPVHQIHWIGNNVNITFTYNKISKDGDVVYIHQEEDLRTQFFRLLGMMDFIKAEIILNETLNKTPNDVSAIDLLGNLHFAKGDINLALETYKRAISIDPKYAHTYFDRGSLYLNLEDYSKALRDLRKAVQLEPGYAEFRMALGAALFNLNKPNEAKKQLMKAVQLDPLSTTARFYLGSTYLKLGEENLAIQQHRWILKNDPESFEAQQIRSLLKALPQ
ncbi:MAG: tetratricopeptide repeat protein [Proteobacteria bacterium]|nr:tetratricopeptide repeat protein [Pseudomonadota bacterium]MBU4258672.1 tetratricopeptide repeat protein [Pseudomonadota bacterium]MBU4288518.1 tetratricopeptide repeat protein [Pseudomonadota bacterium]MBU4414567.1 tetratricopeptide repeat protein [Pseudomonadota bacterium]MCG2758477.1 tetratricopeptide repeat protein [Desulfobacteraceae bacterium]